MSGSQRGTHVMSGSQLAIETQGGTHVMSGSQGGTHVMSESQLAIETQ